MVRAQMFVALVWDGHPALIRVDGAEREILRRRLTFSEHVEEGGFSVVGKMRASQSSVAIINFQ